ncbi:MAG: replication protein, partial [Chloroflexota bacterium]|nr:replication protein [Chloroflexota bacterium]
MPRQGHTRPDFRFGGFDAPQYTQTPDQLFDELLALGVLTNGELRVLLYLIRRTFGFKKATDQVSLSQIVRGILTKDGRRLDWGAGVSKSTAVEAIQGLEHKCIVRVERHQDAANGNETNIYTLCMRHAVPDPGSPGPNTRLAACRRETNRPYFRLFWPRKWGEIVAFLAKNSLQWGEIWSKS